MLHLKRGALSLQAPRFFLDLSGPLEIHGVRKVEDVRRENLELLILEYGTMDALASAADTTSVYLSQIRRQALDSKTGRPRQLGAQMARRLEAARPHSKPEGWMDVARSAQDIEAIRRLIAEQRDKAAREVAPLGVAEEASLYEVPAASMAIKLRDCPAFLLAAEFDALPERLAGGISKAELLRELRQLIARHSVAAGPATA